MVVSRTSALWTILAWSTVAAASASPRPLLQQESRTAQGNELFAAQLDEVALDEMKNAGILGAGIGIVSQGKVVFSKGFGSSSAEDGFAVTSATLFRLGSTTKMFTAAALVKMALAGRIDLRRPISEYTSGLEPAIGALTTDQLLSHMAGLRSNDPPSDSCDESTLATEVRSWKGSRLFTAAGEIFSYSSDGYWLAGFVAESVAGKPYAILMQDEIFGPLGMIRSTFRPTMAITYPVAQGHRISSGKTVVVRPMPDTPASWPAGSMFSTVDDLCRWLLVLLNEGQIKGKHVLPNGTIEQLFAAHAEIPGSSTRYGYGLSIGAYRGVKVLQHGGTRAGYGSFIRIAPEQKTAIVVLTNLQSGQLPKTVEKASELLLSLAEPERPAQRRAQQMSAGEMALYVGVYKNGPTSRVSSVVADGTLTFRDDSPGIELLIRDGELKMRQGQSAFPVSKVGELRFAVRPPGARQDEEFTLVPNRNGSVAYLLFGDFAMKRQQ